MTANLVSLLVHLRRLHAGQPDSDAARLNRFARLGDQRAFAALVEQHGPMVLRVCRRVLGDAHAAEDAAQATFLVLARKAGTIGRAEALAGWLHGVACRVALKARAGLARRGQPLPAIDSLADQHPDPLAELSVRELLAIIDAEVERLPRDYRLPMLLCCLEGHSQEEAARRLGWTPGSVKGRLERGRKLLHARLTRRGIVPAAVFAALELCEAARATAMPAALASTTVRAAIAFTKSPGAVATASSAAARLAGEVLGGAAMSKLKPALVLLLVLGLTAFGAGPFMQPSPTAPPTTSEPKAQPATPKTDEKAHVDREGITMPAEAVARIGSTRLRHAGRVSAVAYAPDGKSIASFDEVGHLCFWDAATGQVQHRYWPSKGGAYAGRLVFPPDGKSVVLFDDHVCRTIDVATGKELRSFPQEIKRGFALYPIFNSTGTQLAIHENTFLRLVDVNSGKEQFDKDLGGLIADAAFSPDGQTLAVSIANGETVILFDPATGKQLRRLEGPRYSAGNLAFASAGKLLFSCGNQPVIWDLTTDKVVGKIEKFYNGHCAVFSPDGKRLAVGGSDGVLIAEAPSGKELRRLPVYGATSLAFTPNGRTLLAGGWDGDISQWDAATGKLLEASASPFPEIKRLSFLDERRLMIETQSFELWDWRAGKVLQRFADFDTGPYGSPAVSADGRWLAYRVGKGEIALIDGRGIEKPRRLPGHKNGCLTLRFAPDGRTLFSSGWDNVVRGWDVASGKMVHEWKDHGDTPTVLVVSPDSRWILAATTGLSSKPKRETAFHVWDAKANRLAHKFSVTERYFLTFAFSPDSRQLAAGGGEEGEFELNTPGHIVLFDLASGDAVKDITGHPQPVYALAFSSDGRCVAAADREWKKEVAFRYWELATGHERHRFEGHTGHVHALAFSPSGAHLAAASPEAPAYIWDVYGKSLPPPGSAKLSADEKQRLWEDLGNADAKAAFQAVRRAIAHPDEAVALLGEHLKPAAPVEMKRVKQWLQDLDDDDYKVRESATRELEKLGDQIEAALKEAVAVRGLPLEPKRRIKALIEKIDGPSPQRLARLRALEALEQIATPAAVRLLERLAGGEAGARMTREASASLDRLRQR